MFLVSHCCRSRQGRWCQSWITNRMNEKYTAKARLEGYRARSAYKLMQMDERFKLFTENTNCVVDLGCCPGSWLQVASERMKLPKRGKHLIGIDLLPVAPVDGAEIVQGDFTENDLQYELLDMIHEAGKSLYSGRGMTPSESDRYQISYLGSKYTPLKTGDMGLYFQGRKSNAVKEVTEQVGEAARKRPLPPAAVDGVMSDMAPETGATAQAEKDIQNHLVELAKSFSIKVLKEGGWFVTKVFQSRSSGEIVRSLQLYFEHVDVSRPPAVQSGSREAFIICRGFIGRARVLNQQYHGGSFQKMPYVKESIYAAKLDHNNISYIQTESEFKNNERKGKPKPSHTQKLRLLSPTIQYNLKLEAKEVLNNRLLMAIPGTKL